jgi:propionate CoA-transferase
MRVVTADEAVRLVHSHDTVLIGGSGGGHAVPESLIAALERRFLAEAAPRALTSVHPVGLGDRGDRGVSRFAHEGMLKRIVSGTLVDSPRIEELALANKVEAYTLPRAHCRSSCARWPQAGLD